MPLNLGERTIRALVSQTGYTGEYGFEIYCKAEDTVDLWKALLKAGEPDVYKRQDVLQPAFRSGRTFLDRRAV